MKIDILCLILCFSLMALQSQTEDTKSLMQENSELLESLKSFDFPSMTMLEDDNMDFNA